MAVRPTAQGILADESREKREEIIGLLEKAYWMEIETAAGPRSYPQATRDEVPGLVASLVHAGEEVYGVKMLASTL